MDLSLFDYSLLLGGICSLASSSTYLCVRVHIPIPGDLEDINRHEESAVSPGRMAGLAIAGNTSLHLTPALLRVCLHAKGQARIPMLKACNLYGYRCSALARDIIIDIESPNRALLHELAGR